MGLCSDRQDLSANGMLTYMLYPKDFKKDLYKYERTVSEARKQAMAEGEKNPVMLKVPPKCGGYVL